ncbi:hypothetical protein AX14_009514 [Amanita brunnescens Koide BX004]|nr:hypothetical protein AX14_009514 [Amanita brunnescens Koide BX004]
MANEITPKRILVIDGGGMRGLASLLIINAIMKELKARTERALLPCQVFDLICGTSVGGLISILLGRLGLDCETAIKIYEIIIKKLFGNERDIWNIIADGKYPNTSDFEFYIGQRIAEFTGSSDVAMRLPLEDNQDPRNHPITKTFVSIMEDAPSYTHIVSSYKRQQLSASASRHWTVQEVMRATMASPIYISPLSIKTDTLRQFQDAGFGGFNNPTVLASSEWKKIWPAERIGLVLSFGTGLRDYLPPTLPTTREWNPTPSYVRRLCDEVFRDRLPGLPKHDDIELNVTYAIRHLARMAVDSSLTHQQFEIGRPSFCDRYYRIDEPFGLSRFDLLDVFQADLVKAHVNNWLKMKSEYIGDIVASLGVKSRPKESVEPTSPATMEVAKTMKPPPPPGDTVKGYNPVMDQPRPTVIQNYLRDFEVLFVIDDSGSMEGTRWDETRDALLEIAQYAQTLNVRSVSLRFLNSDMYDQGIQGSDAIISRFEDITPLGAE